MLFNRKALQNSKLLQKILNAGSLAVAAALFAIIWQYCPESILRLPVSRYSVSAVCALLALVAVQLVRSALKDPLVAINPPSTAKRLPPQQAVAAQLQSTVATDSFGNQGWSHYLGSYPHKQSLSALSTAYALRAAILCNLELPGVDISRIIHGIETKANRDGGWSAQSQGNVSRPEVTAVIGGTLARICGQTAVVKKAAQRMAEMIVPGADPLVTTNTYVLATLLEEAAYLGLSEDQVRPLLDCLLGGAVQVEEGRSYWTERLMDAAHATPSIALTAHSVISIRALARANYSLPSWGLSVVNSATRWLEDASDLHNETSQVIRYPRKGVQELNAPRHFTAALVALALIASSDAGHPAVTRALDKVWSHYGGGVWWWDSGETPAWMTYYGFSAIVMGTQSGAGGVS